MGDTAAMTSSQATHLQEASMASSAFSTIGSTISNVGAIKATGEYQSSIANANAAMAQLKASQTLQAGDLAASRKNLQTQGQVGSVLAQQGASGVQVGSGSAAMVRSSISTAGAIDESIIRNNAARAAWGYQTQAISDTYAGKFAQLTAASKETQAIATGGLQAVAGPLAMYSQSALWQYRYGGRGTSGTPFPTTGSGTTSSASTGDSDFWGSLS